MWLSFCSLLCGLWIQSVAHIYTYDKLDKANRHSIVSGFMKTVPYDHMKR